MAAETVPVNLWGANQWIALGLTLACELPVIWLLARPLPTARILLIATGASCLTHPLAWHVASRLSAAEYPLGVWLIELAVTLTEAVWYRLWLKVSFARALWWSLLANASSFGIGCLLQS